MFSLISGLIFDVTKSYAMSFMFGGVCCLGSGILVMVLVISVKCDGAPIEHLKIEQEGEEEKDLAV
jgi:hypothetical protein